MLHFLTIIFFCILSQFNLIAQSQLITTGFVSNLVPPSPARANRTVEPLGRRLFTIYLPDGYDDPANANTNYPVFYWLPGFGGFNETRSDGNRFILDQLIELGQIIPMILVAPDGSLIDSNTEIDKPVGSPFLYGNSWYVNSELNGAFESYIIDELVPFIDNNFRTIADRNFRGISGHSMGGYGASILGIKHPETFVGFACESPTPIFLISTDLAKPGCPEFVINSDMLIETLDNGGFVNPSGFNTFFIMSMAGALTPNLTGSTPFIQKQSVSMPIIVDEFGKASLIDGTFSIVDFLNGERSVVDQSLVLDESVLDIWREKDYFFFFPSYLDTLEKQAIYYDGGIAEPLNNYGSRLMSDALIESKIDNEYILYQGNHETCLTTPPCARLTTIAKTFSAKFAEAGYCPTDVSVKLMGNLHIVLQNDTELAIPSGTTLQVQTSRVLPITHTNVTLKLEDNAKIEIGNDSTPGGAFQIGDPFGKALLEESNNGPPSPLAFHEVHSAIILDGPNTMFEIGNQGYFGVGIGALGKTVTNVALSPEIANFWGVSSLSNVKTSSVIIERGTFKHTQIASGDESNASVFAYGESDKYEFIVNPMTGTILGGGNFICLQQSNSSNAPPNFSRAVRFMHPTEFNEADNIPDTPFAISGGIRNFMNFNPNAEDLFIDQPVGSTTFYTNTFKRQILSSTELKNKDLAQDFNLQTSSLDSVCDFLETQPYFVQASKEANAVINQSKAHLDYTDDPAFGARTIERFEQSQYPIDPNQTVDFQKAAQDGAIGVQVETITNERQLINVYDLDLP
jgi:hypothetical protein